jgi:hypothetical protein
MAGATRAGARNLLQHRDKHRGQISGQGFPAGRLWGVLPVVKD